MTTRVYVNRTLNIRKIKYIGFDMDHTLIRYHTEAFEAATHKIVLEKLITGKQYPKNISSFKFDYDLAVRGLILDKRKGNLLKVSRHGAIRASMHGTQIIDFATQKNIYGSKYIDLREGGYSSVDTSFSISTAVLFAQLVSFKDANPTLTMPDYETIANDVMNTVDLAHRDGSLKKIVRDDLAKYIIKDPEIATGLERYHKHGKKLFLLTNSDFQYTKLLLDFAINPFLKNHSDWSKLFDIVITGSQKPRFFYDNLKFLKININDGTMVNLNERLGPGVYQGGCAEVFTKDLDLEGDDILYIGDHIYGDILRLKKDCNWRTAMVFEDLEKEIEKYKEAKPINEKIEKLMNEKMPFEDELVALTSEKIESQHSGDDKKQAELQKKINDCDKKIVDLIQKQQKIHNSCWGEIMRAGNEESYFAHQVDRFACIYMSRLTDLLEVSPRTYFRASRRPLAHELAVDA